MLPAARTALSTVGLALVLALAGCADPEKGATVPADSTPSATPPAGSTGPARPTDASPTPTADRTGPPLSATRPPTMGPPTVGPDKPSDLRRANVLTGRITRGGSGPCYGLVTDDGREYALHGVDKGTFVTGTWVKVTTGPADAATDCGPGTPAGIVKISPVG
ncbi:hypothetical protein NCC78_14400 [Micromonospora phytophila]|uniref:hypothetical protein n=1 Tax=Micromonospora phytophila TaxID=709888 RepID=UPI002030C018|nr:hypothetical protein [Micromonospora phytophila]MCM0675870.1 hypothetical protein [Micromonospora phytophila]